MPKTSSAKSARFSAKLLFQFRIVGDGKPGVVRLCEERIVVLRAETARKALTMAKRRGKRAEHRYRNDDGGMVHFELVGLHDLLHLGIECEEDEVWYDITQRKLPKERAAAILPPEHELNAIRNSPF